jgi:hypothetical protein
MRPRHVVERRRERHVVERAVDLVAVLRHEPDVRRGARLEPQQVLLWQGERRDRRVFRDARGLRGRPDTRHELADRRRDEDVGEGELEACVARRGDEVDGADGVAARVEERRRPVGLEAEHGRQDVERRGGGCGDVSLTDVDGQDLGRKRGPGV